MSSLDRLLDPWAVCLREGETGKDSGKPLDMKPPDSFVLTNQQS